MIDIRLNLASEQFNKDRETIIKDALSKNVSGFILTGTSAKASEKVLKLSKKYCNNEVYTHMMMKSWDTSKVIIEKLVKNELVIAVGECDLDYDRMYSTKEEQKKHLKNNLILL